MGYSCIPSLFVLSLNMEFEISVVELPIYPDIYVSFALCTFEPCY